MKLNEQQKDASFKIFIFAVLQLLFFNLQLIISVISGDFNWTIERLTSSLAGIFFQILGLALVLNGVALFIYIVIFLILLVKN